MINVFVGLSIGANVLVAQCSVQGSWQDLEETVHTAMMLALAGGRCSSDLCGCVLVGPMLGLMGTPDDVLPLAACCT
ncbi:MAG: MATE family efflux transporter [Clostridium sp.]